MRICRQFLFFVIVLASLTSCASHSINRNGQTIKYRSVKKYFKHSTILSDHFTGFVLYDFNKEEYLFQHNENKFFTPASNTKLWTLYAALETLGDSIPWMAYDEENDMRIFYPLGDPSFLNPFIDRNERIENYFVNEFEEGDTVYFSIDHYEDFRFGSGWMWDDQSYYFQAEKSVFPIFANSVKLIPHENEIHHEPDWMTIFAGTSDIKSEYREEYQNVFVLPNEITSETYMPVIADRDHYRSYFKSLGLHLEFVSNKYDPASAQTIYSMPSSDLFKFYMETSDNLVAEQLLLQCSMAKLGYMNTHDVIDTLMKNEMSRWQDSWNWHDGSGISRYNLVTPDAMMTLMNTLYQKYDKQLIEDILPTGGEGTLKHWYQFEPPRLFGKTGTLRYCHNLTGIIHTKNGNTLTFSFMHNNFNYSSAKVKEAMTDVFHIIVDRY